jgi:hypothetical protein
MNDEASKRSGACKSRIGLRLGELTLGHAVNAALVYGFDYALYPFVIWKLVHRQRLVDACLLRRCCSGASLTAEARGAHSRMLSV